MTLHRVEVVATCRRCWAASYGVPPQRQVRLLRQRVDGDGGRCHLENAAIATVTQTLDIMPADFDGTRWAADIHITPNGRFLYTSDRTASILTIFSVSDDGGTLSVVGYHPTEAQPRVSTSITAAAS